jgi:hypothetical protein
MPLILWLFLATGSASTGATDEPETPADTGELDHVPEVVRAALVSDAAMRAGVGTEEVRVAKAQHTTWSDGSLGCPKPGEMYTQALVDGWWIVLEAGGTSYDYRTSDRGGFKLCEQPGASPGEANTY